GNGLRTFGNGSGGRLHQGDGPRRNLDPRYRRAFLDQRSEKYARCARSGREGASAHDLRNRLDDDDVSLVAGGLQRRNTQDLLGRLAVPLTPSLGANSF